MNEPQNKDNKGDLERTEKAIRIWAPVFVSVVFGFGSLWTILSGRYGLDSTRWAYGMVGTIIGYWFALTSKK